MGGAARARTKRDGDAVLLLDLVHSQPVGHLRRGVAQHECTSVVRDNDRAGIGEIASLDRNGTRPRLAIFEAPPNST